MEPQVASSSAPASPPEAQTATSEATPKTQETKQSEPYSQGFNEGLKKLDDLRKEVIEQRSLLIVGAIIMLIMLGTVIVMVLLSWSDSNARVLDSNSGLQAQIYQLELNQISAPKNQTQK
jgi:hypothetical protein